jgi:hypothetical protein
VIIPSSKNIINNKKQKFIDMNNRVEFFGDIFKGIGLGLTFGYEYKLLVCSATFLCFNFYIEVYLGKK